MACWQRNWQLTHPPAAARRRRTDKNAAKARTDKTAATPAPTVTAITTAAVSRKCPTERPNTTSTTRRSSAILLAGRA
jgi:hypothetical protein